jgi:hypothetical protein
MSDRTHSRFVTAVRTTIGFMSEADRVTALVRYLETRNLESLLQPLEIGGKREVARQSLERIASRPDFSPEAAAKAVRPLLDEAIQDLIKRNRAEAATASISTVVTHEAPIAEEALPMFTGKTLGHLTIQFSQNNNQQTCFLETKIPLLDGGILYQGALIPSDLINAKTINIHASKDILDVTHYRKSDTGDSQRTGAVDYEVELGDRSDQVNLRKLSVQIFTSPENAQLFYGRVEVNDPTIIPPPASNERQYTFIYRDINEPITFGAIALISLGVYGLMWLVREEKLHGSNAKEMHTELSISLWPPSIKSVTTVKK